MKMNIEMLFECEKCGAKLGKWQPVIATGTANVLRFGDNPVFPTCFMCGSRETTTVPASPDFEERCRTCGTKRCEHIPLYWDEHQAILTTKLAPLPARIICPYCVTKHVDEGEWETRPHHKHKCLACGKLFRFEGADGEYFYGR